jgi:hypothetical protein
MLKFKQEVSHDDDVPSLLNMTEKGAVGMVCKGIKCIHTVLEPSRSNCIMPCDTLVTHLAMLISWDVTNKTNDDRYIT